jgi:HlyD family secretion protein
MSFHSTDHNLIIYQSEINRKQISIYWLVLIIIIASIASLPFIHLDIAIKSSGIIRPIDEKTELKSSLSTVIDTIYFKEGDVVHKGDLILQLRKQNIGIKKSMNDFTISQNNTFIADLKILTHLDHFSSETISQLRSPLYKQQSSRFAFQLAEINTQQKKVNRELYVDSILMVDKIISQKEMFDKQIEHEKLAANIRVTSEQQLAIWHQDLSKYQLEKSQYQNANNQLNEDSNFYSIKAPVTGVLQNFNKFYSGSLVQAGEVLAIISPQATLIAECFVNTRDVGFLKSNQTSIFQVSAFDYNYFGILTGKVISIDNDYTVINDQPSFKVRCKLDSQQLHLKNGFNGKLKKGMTFQARFVVAKRSLWQLLFDKVDDWVNPIAA